MLVFAVFWAFALWMPRAAEAGYPLQLCLATVAALMLVIWHARSRGRPIAIAVTLTLYMMAVSVVGVFSRGDARLQDLLQRYGSTGAYGALLLMTCAMPLFGGVYFTEAYAGRLARGGLGAGSLRKLVCARISMLWSALFASCLVVSVLAPEHLRLASAASLAIGLFGTKIYVRSVAKEGARP